MKELTERFIDSYLTRREVMYRLPVRTPIRTFWPALLEERKKQALQLPLRDQQGGRFWYVLNRSIEQQADRVAEIARREIAFETLQIAPDDALIEEAVWSSVIEGAFTSRADAKRIIRKDIAPGNRSEQMVRNNYRALTSVLEHIDEPITREMLVEIAGILTYHASDETVNDYRTEMVYVTGKEGIVYTPPTPEAVPGMMEELIRFINTSETHPILKACIAHFYLVYVHPFSDGNGRTARAISYRILLQCGYDLFRYFSISGMIAEERSRYYRSIVNVEDPENSGNDMTYFIDYYTAMLTRVVEKMEAHIRQSILADRILDYMRSKPEFNERRSKGIEWLLQNGSDYVTVEQWKKHFGITTETARTDLLSLMEAGLVKRRVEGRKAVFELPKTNDEIMQMLNRLA